MQRRKRSRGGWGKSGPLSLLFKYLLTVKCVEATDWLLLQTTEVVMSGIQNFPEKCIRLLSSKTFVNDFESHSCPAGGARVAWTATLAPLSKLHMFPWVIEVPKFIKQTFCG